MEENTETAQVCRKKERYFSRFSGEKKTQPNGCGNCTVILIFIAVYIYVYTYDKFGKIGPTFPRVFKKKRNIEEAKDIRVVTFTETNIV